MFSIKEIKKTALISLWFIFLTFPIMVIKVDPIERIVQWRWKNAIYVGIGIFCIRVLMDFLKYRQSKSVSKKKEKEGDGLSFIHRIIANPAQRNILVAVIL